MKKLLTLFVLTIISPAFAAVDDSDLCLYHTSQVEQSRGIKENILSTISLVETGRSSSDKVLGNPWPWTIAYQGKGLYFDTKEEAVSKVKSLLKQGIESIDVGCMQVNLYYHGDAFASVEDAFNPSTNVEYAADFLSRLYKKHGNWGAAATAYHSHEPTKAYKYETKLIKVWSNLKKYLASGGKLYDEPQSIKIANAFKVQPKSKTAYSSFNSKPIAPKQVKKDPVSRNLAGSSVSKIPSDYKLDFASQWRARKLTEYRLKKAEENQIYRSNMTNDKES